MQCVVSLVKSDCIANFNICLHVVCDCHLMCVVEESSYAECLIHCHMY